MWRHGLSICNSQVGPPSRGRGPLTRATPGRSGHTIRATKLTHGRAQRAGRLAVWFADGPARARSTGSERTERGRGPPPVGQTRCTAARITACCTVLQRTFPMAGALERACSSQPRALSSPFADCSPSAPVPTTRAACVASQRAFLVAVVPPGSRRLRWAQITDNRTEIIETKKI